MIVTWQYIIDILIIANIRTVCSQEAYVKSNTVNWMIVESLAEHHPYVVALLNISKVYLCTGTVINKSTVLTSGNCLVPELHYVAIGSAIINKNISDNALFEIAGTALHEDYAFKLKSTDPNTTKMHSNIGLIFIVRPSLDKFMPAADLGNYYAPELFEKDLITIGYGRISEIDMVVLQFQDYRQGPCKNPKWYYCVCGYESSKYSEMLDSEFGEGAPVFLGTELVGVAAASSRLLELKSMGVKFNIFTILGPYMHWIEKIKSKMNKKFIFRSRNTAHRNSFANVYGFLAVIIILN